MPKPGERFLDLAAGTGAFSKALKEVEARARVTAADFCIPILKRMPAALGSRVGADAMRLPFRGETFDGFVVAFGIRNFSDPRQGLAEIHRVLRPGGRGLILDFLRPQNTFIGLLYRLYLRWWIPILGGLCSGSFSSYKHLTDTIHTFLTRNQFRSILEGSGFRVIEQRELSFGAATAFFVHKYT